MMNQGMQKLTPADIDALYQALTFPPELTLDSPTMNAIYETVSSYPAEVIKQLLDIHTVCGASHHLYVPGANLGGLTFDTLDLSGVDLREAQVDEKTHIDQCLLSHQTRLSPALARMLGVHIDQSHYATTFDQVTALQWSRARIVDVVKSCDYGGPKPHSSFEAIMGPIAGGSTPPVKRSRRTTNTPPCAQPRRTTRGSGRIRRPSGETPRRVGH